MSKIEQTQDELEEVKVVMRDNIEKVMERDVKISDLEDRSEQLKDGASRFHITSRKLRRQMWWQDKKMTCFFILVILLVLIIVIVPIAVTSSK